MTDKPLVTFVLIVYQQERYVRDALLSVLAQDYSPLEIIASDDASTDGSFELMQEIAASYQGPHRLVVRRNEHNLGVRGLGAHVSAVLAMVRGELIVVGAGDDISENYRVTRLVQLWADNGYPQGSLHSAASVIDDQGREQPGMLVTGEEGLGEKSLADCISSGMTGILGATHAFTRIVWDRFGTLPDMTIFEDRTLAFRSRLLGRILYTAQPLVRYRRHDDTLSGEHIFVDSKRWVRWVAGLRSCVGSHERDYLLVHPGPMEPSVRRALDSRRHWVEQVALLLEPGVLTRLRAALAYSSGWPLRTRLSFVAHRCGMAQSAAYQRLAAWWRSLTS